MQVESKRPGQRQRKGIALAQAFAQHPSVLARVLSAAVDGIEAFPVEVEVNRLGGHDGRDY